MPPRPDCGHTRRCPPGPFLITRQAKQGEGPIVVKRGTLWAPPGPIVVKPGTLWPPRARFWSNRWTLRRPRAGFSYTLRAFRPLRPFWGLLGALWEGLMAHMGSCGKKTVLRRTMPCTPPLMRSEILIAASTPPTTQRLRMRWSPHVCCQPHLRQVQSLRSDATATSLVVSRRLSTRSCAPRRPTRPP